MPDHVTLRATPALPYRRADGSFTLKLEILDDLETGNGPDKLVALVKRQNKPGFLYLGDALERGPAEPEEGTEMTETPSPEGAAPSTLEYEVPKGVMPHEQEGGGQNEQGTAVYPGRGTSEKPGHVTAGSSTPPAKFRKRSGPPPNLFLQAGQLPMASGWFLAAPAEFDDECVRYFRFDDSKESQKTRLVIEDRAINLKKDPEEFYRQEQEKFREQQRELGRREGAW